MCLEAKARVCCLPYVTITLWLLIATVHFGILVILCAPVVRQL